MLKVLKDPKKEPISKQTSGCIIEIEVALIAGGGRR